MVNFVWRRALSGTRLRVVARSVGGSSRVTFSGADGQHCVLCQVEPLEDAVGAWSGSDDEGLQVRRDEIRAMAARRVIVLSIFAKPITSLRAHLVPHFDSRPTTRACGPVTDTIRRWLSLGASKTASSEPIASCPCRLS